MAYFTYGERELAHLRSRDARLADAIDRIGPVRRTVDPDLFSSVVHHIIGQQISTKAQATIWARMRERLGEVTPETVRGAGRDALQELGMTYRKADYLVDVAERVATGALDLEAVRQMPDDEAIAQLMTIRGVGRWTAEMILLFCLERPDVLSYDDLAIQRGLRMLYCHRRITPRLFARYRRRYSPHGSTASLYLWAIAGGALPDLIDRAPASPKKRPSARGAGAPGKAGARTAANPKAQKMKGEIPVITATYPSPLGPLVLAADEQGLAGAWFEGQTHFGEFGSTRRALGDTERTEAAPTTENGTADAARSALEAARAWLDAYFAGTSPEALPPLPPLHLLGSPFQQRVWELLRAIPYGGTTTYGALAHELEERFGTRTSARAVGGAVGRNPLSIIVPCHRVLGANGAVTGYAGGLERKRALLALEGRKEAS